MRFRGVRKTTLLLTLAGPAAALAEPGAIGPRVTVGAGIIEGTSLGSTPRWAAFRGIPYAAAPSGPWRWNEMRDSGEK